MNKRIYSIILVGTVFIGICIYQITKPNIEEVLSNETTQEEISRRKVQLDYEEKILNQMNKYENVLKSIPYNIESNGNFITSNIDSRIINGDEYYTQIGSYSYIDEYSEEIQSGIAMIHQVQVGQS